MTTLMGGLGMAEVERREGRELGSFCQRLEFASFMFRFWNVEKYGLECSGGREWRPGYVYVGEGISCN